MSDAHAHRRKTFRLSLGEVFGLTRVVVVDVDASAIFNLASPRYLPELFRAWSSIGFEGDPWDEQFEPLRELCERRYIELFNARTGHYAALERSILAEGFRNPVMLSAGTLDRRPRLELPPDLRERPDVIACEYCGGSRVFVAAKLGLTVPAVINDRCGVISGGREIASGDTESLLACFADKPRRVFWRADGSVYANYLPFAHYAPARREFLQGAQREIRRQIVQQVIQEANEWRRSHEAVRH